MRVQKLVTTRLIECSLEEVKRPIHATRFTLLLVNVARTADGATALPVLPFPRVTAAEFYVAPFRLNSI